MLHGLVSRPLAPFRGWRRSARRSGILLTALLASRVWGDAAAPTAVASQHASQAESQAQSSTGTQTSSAGEIAAGYERLDAFTQGLQTLQADFHQTLRDGRGRTVEESEGTLSLARPGRFRWDYRKPHIVQVVSDGTRLWQYDQDLQQVTVRKVDATLADTPAMLLSGRGSLRDSFVVKRTESSGSLFWVVLQPKRADTDFREVRLGFEAASLNSPGNLKAMELADKLGQTTNLDFEQLKRNPRLDDGRFGFQVPPGVDVIGETAPAGPALH